VIVVLDNSVVISALQFKNPRSMPSLACEKAKSLDTIAVCDEIEAEMCGVLTDTFQWPASKAQQAVASLMSGALRLHIFGGVRVCRDPKDDMFLECADLAKADFLISGDKDLLVLGSYKRTRIVSPAEYVRLGS